MHRVDAYVQGMGIERGNTQDVINNRAGSSGRLWSRGWVGGKGQVFTVIQGILHYQGDKPTRRLSRFLHFKRNLSSYPIKTNIVVQCRLYKAQGERYAQNVIIHKKTLGISVIP